MTRPLLKAMVSSKQALVDSKNIGRNLDHIVEPERAPKLTDLAP